MSIYIMILVMSNIKLEELKIDPSAKNSFGFQLCIFPPIIFNYSVMIIINIAANESSESN